MKRGALTISIDLELAWGVWDKPSNEYFDRCAELESRIVKALLAAFDRHGICATWATVGRLLERAPELPVSSRHGERIWYAPDVVDQIRKAKTEQEIGSHSFAHVYFDRISRAEADEDLEAARRVHQREGLEFRSFVYPRNAVAHVDALRAHGIEVFRSDDRGWFIDAKRLGGKRVGQAANLVDKVIPIAPRAVPVEQQNGIAEVAGSMLLMARKGLRRLAHPELVRLKARRGMAAAQREGRVFHLWFHPSNFYWETDKQLALLEVILADAAKLRDRGEIDVLPMRAFASTPSA